VKREWNIEYQSLLDQFYELATAKRQMMKAGLATVAPTSVAQIDEQILNLQSKVTNLRCVVAWLCACDLCGCLRAARRVKSALL
jgi:hypothetical protein